MTVQIIDSLATLNTIATAWDDLALHALEPNVFYERWALLPAMTHLAATTQDHIQIALIWADHNKQQLVGLFPLRSDTRYRKFPTQHWLTWDHIHCYVGAPLIRSGTEQYCFEQFFSWLWQQTPASVFTVSKIPMDGDFYQYLIKFLCQKNCQLDELDCYQRALLHSELNVNDYLSNSLKKKKLKELKRLQRRLMDLGHVATTHYNHADHATDLSTWIDNFLDLEQRGWKGQQKTALASNAAESAYARELIQGAAQRKQLLLSKITLDNRPIAMKLSFITGKHAFAFKIAYDEYYAQYSPGVLLELDNMKTVLDSPAEQPAINWMDSCADPHHPMIDHLWRERRNINNLHISNQTAKSKSIIRVMRFAKASYQSLRTITK